MSWLCGDSKNTFLKSNDGLKRRGIFKENLQMIALRKAMIPYILFTLMREIAESLF